MTTTELHPATSDEPAGAARDSELLVLALAGDTKAWEELVARHERLLTRVAVAIVGQDARDVVQSAWLRLLEHGASIRNPCSLRAWLIRVVRTEAIGIYRRRAREQVSSGDNEWVDSVVSAEPTAESHAMRSEMVALLRGALGELAPRHRRLLSMLADGDANYGEVGAALSMPIGSIGPTRARALRRLRDALIARGVDEELAIRS
jgi:RNA polymerase sigma factor (sigma-70 family)